MHSSRTSTFRLRLPGWTGPTTALDITTGICLLCSSLRWSLAFSFRLEATERFHSPGPVPPLREGHPLSPRRRRGRSEGPWMPERKTLFTLSLLS